MHIESCMFFGVSNVILRVPINRSTGVTGHGKIAAAGMNAEVVVSCPRRGGRGKIKSSPIIIVTSFHFLSSSGLWSLSMSFLQSFHPGLRMSSLNIRAIFDLR